MITDILKRLALMVLLVLLQVLVLNRIHLFYLATPFLFIMLPLQLNSEQPRWSALLWAFCTGLLVDIFSNTPGVTAGALTIIGLVQPPFLHLFKQDEEDVLVPTAKNMGWIKFITYSTVLTFTFCLFFFTLETFTFFNPLLWIESIGASTLITLIIIWAIEKIRG